MFILCSHITYLAAKIHGSRVKSRSRCLARSLARCSWSKCVSCAEKAACVTMKRIHCFFSFALFDCVYTHIYIFVIFFSVQTVSWTHHRDMQSHDRMCESGNGLCRNAYIYNTCCVFSRERGRRRRRKEQQHKKLFLYICFSMISFLNKTLFWLYNLTCRFDFVLIYQLRELRAHVKNAWQP